MVKVSLGIKISLTMIALTMISSSHSALSSNKGPAIDSIHSALMIYDFQIRGDEENALRITATWKTLLPADSMIEYKEEGTSGDWLQTPLNEEAVYHHQVTVVGLKEETEYMFRPVSNDATGPALTLSTGQLPDILPYSELVYPNSFRDGFFITGFPAPRSAMIAVDNDGQIVWYHTDSDGGDPGTFRRGEDGRLVYSINRAIKAVDYMGNEEVLLDVQSLGDECHHDFQITPEGNYLYLSRDTVYANDLDWCVDTIVERDASGNKLWEWKTGNYAQELGGFSFGQASQYSYVEGCGYDWTHSNSIDLATDSQGNEFIYLSIRNMNRIIKIDYPSGDIIWQLGENLDFTYTGSESEELRWFRSQHAARFIDDVSLVLFDNGNDRYADSSKNYSRVLKYQIDDPNKEAEIVWELDLGAYASHSGNVEPSLAGDFNIVLPLETTMSRSSIMEADAFGDVIWKTDFYYPQASYTNFIVGSFQIESLYDLTRKEDYSLRVATDFDGDGRADILWRHAASGGIYLWLMDGHVIGDHGGVATVSDLEWQIIAGADFDGDDRSDILWRHAVTGQVYLWIMDGFGIKNHGSLVTVSDLSWQVIGTGDFDGDGRADVLWRHAESGEVYLWLMDGFAIEKHAGIPTISDFTWQIVGIDDFTGDGRADILWRHAASGEVYLWLMDSFVVEKYTKISVSPEIDWQVIGVGDFDGDSRADILWRHDTTGQVYLWLMDGSIIKHHGTVSAMSESYWRKMDLADFNGDGRDDILWRYDPFDDIYLWLMDGIEINSEETLPLESATNLKNN